MSRYCVSLDRRMALKASVAGGKGASLARLIRQGYPVPQGFIVLPEAFRTHLSGLSVDQILQKDQWLKGELALTRAFVQESQMHRAVEHAIVRAIRRLQFPVAVRSSMIGEDSAHASFAGQLDTVLHVEDHESLIRAVKQCWASVFNWRLSVYLNEHHGASSLVRAFSIAVVIQEMVPASAAGVAFSVDPVSGKDQVVIEAVPGFGDALVDGRIEPDRYVVDKGGAIVQVQAGGSREPHLSAAQVSALGRLVQQVHQSMGGPQDVEWAWDGRAFFLLQSRPITSLAGAHVYTNSMVAEMLPGLIKPLVWSVSAEAKLQHVLGRIFTELIGPSDMDFTQLAKRIGGRVYADRTVLETLLGQLGLPPNAFEMMSHGETATQRQRPKIKLSMLRTMMRVVRSVVRHSHIAEEIETYLSVHTSALEPYQLTDWEACGSQELLQTLSELRRLYNESLWMNFIGPLNMLLRNRLLGDLTKRWAPQVAANDLVYGFVGTKALDSRRRLERLAERARSLDPDTVRLLGKGEIEAIESTLSATASGRALLADIDDFLTRYGFLNTVGTDLSRAPWIEDPIVIWRSIARLAAALHGYEDKDCATIRETAHSRARESMRGWQYLIFRRVLRATTRYIHLRERTSVLISRDSYQLRRVLLALARQLVADGTLKEPDDIFYLDILEVEQLVNGALGRDDAMDAIAARRAELDAAADLELPDTIYGDNVPAAYVALAPSHASLTGISGSSGIVEGKACIVLDPSQAPVSLTPEHILIVPFSDVGWTPLFVGVGGLIAETGGQLSHSAIIAREFGLPAVVNVKHATRLIRDGQTVTVDGDHGRVHLH